MIEKWLPIPNYEGLYSVSDMGRVRSEDRTVQSVNGPRKFKGRILRSKRYGAKRTERYDTVTLWKNGTDSKFRVHVLVLATFVGPCPKGMEILHRDDDPANPALSNLRYGTHAENKADEIVNNTHCRSGKHEWNDENTYKRPDKGTRQCRGCARDRKLAA